MGWNGGPLSPTSMHFPPFFFVSVLLMCCASATLFPSVKPCSISQVLHREALNVAARIGQLGAVAVLPLMVKKVGKGQHVTVAASVHVYGSGRSVEWGSRAAPPTATAITLRATPEASQRYWRYGVEVDKVQGDWWTFVSRPLLQVSEDAPTLSVWEGRLVGVWLEGARDDPLLHVESTLRLLFPILGDFMEGTSDRIARRDRLVVGILGPGILAASSGKGWAEPQTQEEAIDNRHLTLNFRVHAAFHRTVVQVMGAPPDSASEATPPSAQKRSPQPKQSKPAVPEKKGSPGKKGVSILVAGIADEEWADVSHARDAPNKLHVAQKESAEGYRGTCAYTIRVGQSRAASNFLKLPRMFRRLLPGKEGESRQLGEALLLAVWCNNRLLCIALQQVAAGRWAWIPPSHFPFGWVVSLGPDSLSEGYLAVGQRATAQWRKSGVPKGKVVLDEEECVAWARAREEREGGVPSRPSKHHRSSHSHSKSKSKSKSKSGSRSGRRDSSSPSPRRAGSEVSEVSDSSADEGDRPPKKGKKAPPPQSPAPAPAQPALTCR